MKKTINALMIFAMIAIILATIMAIFLFRKHFEERDKTQSNQVHAIAVIVDGHEYTVFLDIDNNSTIVHNPDCKKCKK